MPGALASCDRRFKELAGFLKISKVSNSTESIEDAFLIPRIDFLVFIKLFSKKVFRKTVNSVFRKNFFLTAATKRR